MMRDLTTHELLRMQGGECPQCGSRVFQPGPSGGAAQNFECVGCQARFNLTIFHNMLVFAQVIEPPHDRADWADYRAAFKPRQLYPEDGKNDGSADNREDEKGGRRAR